MAHEVHLSDPAFEILRSAPRRSARSFLFGDGEFAFSGWSKAKVALDGRTTAAMKLRDGNDAGIAPWRVHDIRRTIATKMGDIGCCLML
jgi:hypothetical protein